ncbi:MAG: hypothetical protein F4091_09290 [Acidimicrobiales bacterium]|nr:hypothetical protein [Acidimicrobiales bacterium]MYD82944.1 hypothetical protein [Acidimicrobiales bacterium]MYJ65643.1 hypothetical protein [Acidimicrobiales bacterium]
MSETYVGRTCTRLVARESGRQAGVESGPLSSFRSERAYVLLGDAGSGKSTEFGEERKALGDAAEVVSARRFVTVEVRPTWQGKTLFIDGLDEIRVGSGDGRSALDQIRNRLDQLGWPNFRISCREADWLGRNDRRSLESDFPGGTVTVLRLDPLSNNARRALAAEHLKVDDVSEFLDAAERRGLGGMLDNPLTLELLTGAFAHGGGSWPESRRVTFELACERMAQEHNEEHIAAATPSPSVEAALTAAGELCAIQLLAGIDGFSLGPADEGSPYVAIDQLHPPIADTSRREAHLRRHVLGTKLFSSARDSEAADGWPRMMPLHRHVAEFLGGRYLASLVSNGLPARRIVALMISPHDGRVVTSLRGLSAWLAAHSAEALDRLADADPVGIGLYGDIGWLNNDQKRLLLRALAEYAAEGPLLGHEWRDDRGTHYRDSTAWAFRSLINVETVDVVADLLRGQADEAASDRVADFLLRVLQEAEGAISEAAKPLADKALAIARESNRSAHVRRSALEAFVHLESGHEARDDAVAALLTDIAERRLTDPDDDLAGLSLRELYPYRVTPGEVWSYLRIGGRENYFGAFASFWSHSIVNQSSARDAAEALDALWAEIPRQSLRDGIDEMLHRRAQDMMPVELLTKALDALGDEVATKRLFGWLAAAAICGRDIHPAARRDLYASIAEAEQELSPLAIERLDDSGIEEESTVAKLIDPARQVRDWLEQRPDRQRQVYMEWLRLRRDDGPVGYRVWNLGSPLFFSTLPRDLYRWCLEQALALEASDPDFARDILTHVVRLRLHDLAVNESLTLDDVSEATKNSPLLSAEFEALLAPAPLESKHVARNAEIREIHRERDRTEHELRQQWADHVRSNLQALRDGSFPVNDLHSLAHVYFGHRYGSDQDASGEERITEFLQGESKLAAAVSEALTAAVYRAELPSVDETIVLHADSKHAWGAWPLFAGLGLVERDQPEHLQSLDDERKRRVLATFFCVPHSLDRAPSWLESWLAANPELVAEVLTRCVTGAIRAGVEPSYALNVLSVLGFDERTKHQIRRRVLKSFPTAAPQRQLHLLDSLLFDVIGGSQVDGVQSVIETKLAAKSLTVAQRARWLATALFLFEGPYVDALAEFAAQHPAGAHRVAEFIRQDPGLGPRWRGATHFTVRLQPATLAMLIGVLGRAFPPLESNGSHSVAVNAADWVSSFINRLSESPTAESTGLLLHLEQMPEMSAWRDPLRYAREAQAVIRRQAEYRAPDVNEVQRTLSGGTPANAADLAALLLDRLADIADEMRGDTGDPWRAYWNEDQYGRPEAPKPENSCRDALLTTLSGRLPPEVDVVREGSYAANKRVDIRVSCAGFNVPIEIKRESRRDLWHAMHNQLLGQYTTDPASHGYGIYLVLWFGTDSMPTPASGQRPRTPEELREMLEASLSLDEARKIAVRVIDVTKPGS